MLKRKWEDPQDYEGKRVSMDNDPARIAETFISLLTAQNNNDTTYVNLRMLCPVREASLIVGKGGETVNRIKDTSNCRISVSENIRDVPERVVSVKGPAEAVAQGYGLIARVLLDEPFGVNSSMMSKNYSLRLLFPHPIVGFLIGKQGSRFREIEDLSAAVIKADDGVLPGSDDRVVTVTGVADAIHIAVYYISQTALEHKELMTNSAYYNPGYSGDSFDEVKRSHSPMNPYSKGAMGMGQGMGQGMALGTPLNNDFTQVPASNFDKGAPNHIRIVPAKSDALPGADTIQEVFVPKHHIGLIIGKGGKNLTYIKSRTGCYVRVVDEEATPGMNERKLLLNGNEEARKGAINLINNRIDHEVQKQGSGF